MNKEALRKESLQKLKELSSQRKKESSVAFAEKVFSYKSALIASYFSRNEELDTQALNEKLFSEKRLLLPGMVGDEIVLYKIDQWGGFKKNRFGFFEPDPAIHLPQKDLLLVDFCLIPGLAFDLANNRLGRGCGHYDRFLKKLPRARLIGVCFYEQIQKQFSFPIDYWDISMDEVWSF